MHTNEGRDFAVPPVRVVAAAQERGRGWDPWTATEELMGVL